VIAKRAILLVGAACLWCAAVAAAPAGNLPRPPELEPDIQFWTRVYTEVDTRGGLIHDSSHLGVVYEVLRFPEGAGPRTQRRLVKETKRRYKKILSLLAAGRRSNLTDEQARVLALWPEGVSNATLSRATRRLRFQLGQADKFRAGLSRSGKWEAHIREVLSEHGLPIELVALPHVESSFNPKARSRVGAAGMWQFTRSTGRRFMRIDRSVDERMDPHLSTIAAAKLLSHNYAATGTWPLAITSYNHGTAGMRRAARKLGTKDITRIVRGYKSRRFGFASRNFYVAFLAAVEIHFNPDKYFDHIPRQSPPPTHVLRVPDYMRADTLQRALGIDGSVLRELNPALQPSIWRGAKYVPRGFELRTPASKPRAELMAALSTIGEDERYAAQQRDRYYKVRRGNTLAGIARHFEVDIDDLVAINDLRSRHRIRAGQVLTLPLPDGVKVDDLPPAPSQSLPVRPDPTLVAENGEYTVRRGDSVWLIARRLGVAEGTLLALNDIGDGDRIHIGQVLRVAPQTPPPVTVAAAETGAPAAGAESVTGVDAPAVVSSAAESSAVESSAAESEAVESEAAESEAAESEAAESKAAESMQAAHSDAPQAATAVPTWMVSADDYVAPSQGAASPDAQSPATAGEVDEAVQDLPGEGAPAAHVSDGLIARVEQAEPVSEEEAEAISPAQPLAVQPDLSADPSDYSVAGESIEVQAAETLGHYADWLEVRAWRLRHLNGMRYGQPVVIGQRITLDFTRVSATEFEQRRLGYHQSLQEAFFKRFRIAGTRDHVIRSGESLWILARRTYDIPIWLLRQYNPDLDFDTVDIGITVVVPQLEPLDEAPLEDRTTTARLN